MNKKHFFLESRRIEDTGQFDKLCNFEHKYDCFDLYTQTHSISPLVNKYACLSFKLLNE